MQIRAAQPEDLESVRACASAAYSGYIADIGREPAPMVADFAAQIAEGWVHLACDAASEMLGFIVFYPRLETMFLENVAVLPAASGRGVGRALIGFCEAAARAEGLPSVTLYTNALMSANLRIYPRLGYTQTDRRREDGFDRVYFRKTF